MITAIRVNDSYKKKNSTFVKANVTLKSRENTEDDGNDSVIVEFKNKKTKKRRQLHFYLK